MTGTVLIVDDESAGRDTVESILDGEGYVLLMATNGTQAIEMARANQPDIILMDVMMPGMTGFEACRHIRSDSDLAEIPIILLTALDDRKSLLTGLDAGAVDFITKPFDRYELRARLAGIMRLNRFRKLVQERNNVEEEHRKLQLAYDATIEGWSHAMDLRDKETEGHTQRVTELTLKMAHALHIGEENLAHIRRGALLHDIGKLGVPDSILLKEGKLTDEEWVIMRKHPIYAHEMLSQIDYLRPALDIPYCHHEKWDGTGYPRGLKGEEIPLAARMFAIVDVWDAVTSDRPYRAAWSKEQALAYIIEHSGTQFDPEIVQVFLKVIKKDM